MTSEDIIQRLLDEKKITVKEAMVILKDLAKIGIQEASKNLLPDCIIDWIPKKKNKKISKMPTTTVMYGVISPIIDDDNIYNWYTKDDTINYNTTASTLTNTTNDETGKSDE